METLAIVVFNILICLRIRIPYEEVQTDFPSFFTSYIRSSNLVSCKALSFIRVQKPDPAYEKIFTPIIS